MAANSSVFSVVRYLDGWCHLRNDLRSFAVDAIAHCDLLADSAHDVDPDQRSRVRKALHEAAVHYV